MGIHQVTTKVEQYFYVSKFFCSIFNVLISDFLKISYLSVCQEAQLSKMMVREDEKTSIP